jgi:hypothetical protein
MAMATMATQNTPAEACEMRMDGSTIEIVGEIVLGDQFKFQELLKAPDRVANVRLNSPGGNIYASGEIARQIRAAVPQHDRRRCA